MIDNSKVTAIATALSVIVLVMTLCWDHRWRRRQYAIGLLEKWNDCTADHAKAILTEFPWLQERGAQIDSLLSEEKRYFAVNPEIVTGKFV